jgi:fermentation-respiration switch protein FrsA (DUF1100 family)
MKIVRNVAVAFAVLVALLVLGATRPFPVVPAAPVALPHVPEAGILRTDLRFPCGDSECAGWLFRPEGAPPPVVVMAHGMAGTRDVALEAFALAFARRKLAAFVFDYRSFGASGGGPRQLVDPWRQLEDWAAAVTFVRARDDVDGSRLALWGSSLGGGHAIITGARDPAVRAVVAQAPLVDTTQEGEAAALGVGAALRLLFTAWADVISAIGSDEAWLVPAIAPPGAHGLIVDPAAYAAFERLVEPGSLYRNAVAARSLLTFDEYDPSVQGASLEAPLLLIASRDDRFASFAGAEGFAATHPNAAIAEIGGDHFDIYSPPHRDEAARLAADFLARELAPATDR